MPSVHSKGSLTTSFTEQPNEQPTRQTRTRQISVDTTRNLAQVECNFREQVEGILGSNLPVHNWSRSKMKSLITGALAAASFAASFAASVETQIEQRVAPPVRQVISPVEKVLEPVAYNVFGSKLLPVPADKADRLVVVSAKNCPPCRRLEPIIQSLAKDGYNAKVVMVEEYNGEEHVSATPTLFYYNGDKLIQKRVGFQDRDAITKVLQKPTVEMSND